MLTSDSTRLSARTLRLTMAMCACLFLWPLTAGATELAAMEQIIDEARLTFARFTGHPNMTWFKDRARNARAIFIAPHVTRASFLFGAEWGTGVLLVRDPSTERWSEPAFYRLVGASFGLQAGALTSAIVALATDDLAAGEMVDGAFTLGMKGLIGIGQIGGGISGSLETTTGTGFVTAATASGVYGGVSLGGTLVLLRNGANELYYGQPMELSDFNEGLARNWYSDRLIKALTDLDASDAEARP